MYDAVGIRRSCRRLALAASWQNTILRSADLLLLFARAYTLSSTDYLRDVSAST